MPHQVTVKRRFPSISELQQMPVGDRAPRLRALLAFHQAGLEDPNPNAAARHRGCIRRLLNVARMVGIHDLNEP